MRYQLVFQWPASSLDDYDTLIAIEDALMAVYWGRTSVDGHDSGSGEMNIFVDTSDPHRAFAKAEPVLKRLGMFATVKVAFRRQLADGPEETFTVLWPKDLTTFNVILLP